MNTCILTGVNAKFVHTNLAIRYLKASAPDIPIKLCEVTINDHLSEIINRLLAFNGTYYGFSCYIWNIEMIQKISEILKKSRPDAIIFWGGPEVSYDCDQCLKECPYVDYILAGEAETIFPKFLEAIASDDVPRLEELEGVYGQQLNNKDKHLAIIDDLSILPFPYKLTDFEPLTGKILYYESMRGCPFNCAYCLSSTLKSVRYLPLERVFGELDCFINQGVRQVKFVDRTFNVDQKRTLAILKYLLQKSRENKINGTNFHFEIAGDLLNDELVDLIVEAPKGLLQFEIGVQSTNTQTLHAITRQTVLEKIYYYAHRLVQNGNCHIHLDLIAGLPYEDYVSFGQSFNNVMGLRPQMLQLGFLKMLKGTAIRWKSEDHGYQYASFPPYEVISNDYISANELLKLKHIEDLLDRYYNSGAFTLTLNFLWKSGSYPGPFQFFEDFADYWEQEGLFESGIARDTLYMVFKTWLEIQGMDNCFNECLKMDYLLQGKRSLPVFFEDTTPRREIIFEWLKDSKFIETYLPDKKGIPAKQLVKQLVFQYFKRNTLNIMSACRKELTQKGELCIFEKGKVIVAEVK